MKKLVTAAEQNALLDELLGGDRSEAILFARQASLLVALNDLAGREETELSQRRQFPILELAGTLRSSQQGVTWRSAQAERLVGFLPLTHAACLRGELLVAQAKVLLDVTRHAAAPVTHRLEQLLLPGAMGWSTADLRRRAAALLLQVESDLDAEGSTTAAADRLAAARANRKVTLTPEVDGTAGLWAVLPAEQAVAFRRDLDELARHAKISDRAAGVVRTADQCRADLLAALPGLVLRGGCRGTGGVSGAAAGAACAAGGAGAAGGAPIGVLLNVLVPMDTLVDRGVQPATLDGYGPISAEHVRQLRPGAHIRPVYVDASTGRPITLGEVHHPPAGDETAFRRIVQDWLHPLTVTDSEEPQHDPSARLSRLVALRDARCAGPGCSVPARRCDRDHHTPYDHSLTKRSRGRNSSSRKDQPGDANPSLTGTPALPGPRQGSAASQPEAQPAGRRRQPGPTAAWNLTCLSRRCHLAKHHGWTVTLHPDGSATWTSPLGRSYDKPAPHDRPLPTDWARYATSDRWGPTGLQLITPTQHSQTESDHATSDDNDTGTGSNESSGTGNVRAGGAGTRDDDQDWDWGRRIAARHRKALQGDLEPAHRAAEATDQDELPPW